MRTRLLGSIFLLGVLAACGATPETGDEPLYQHVAPPAGDVPESLRAETWVRHWTEDIAPYWTMDAALGTPAGNYPTYRGMDGAPTSRDARYPRMISRQIYAYAMGYALTGDDALLVDAQAGVDWLLNHARDETNGGWYPVLDAQGNPAGTDPKWAQDAAYDALGLAAWFFVTRDPRAEEALLDIRDMLFDPALYWDDTIGRIRDGLSFDMSAEADAQDDGGAELVAQLDPINAFLLLVQPVLSDEARRTQLLGDLETLGHVIVDDFYDNGIFWGVSTKKNQYGTWHADFGHTLKSYWMLLEIDKRLPDHPFHDLVVDGAPKMLELAWDDEYGRWAKAPISPTLVRYGPDWWEYAEADQLAATLDLLDYHDGDRLATSWGHFPEDFVDRTRPAREVVSAIARDGSWVWDWPDSDTAKCNEWKNGYHVTEHAVVGALLGANREDAPAVLNFAVTDPDGFEAVPYFFQGRVTGRESLGTVAVGGRTLTKVRVSFDGLY